MSMEITGLCIDHSFESATAICRRCGKEYCDMCLVFPFGEKKPLCKDCAMLIAAVKTQARRPEMAPRFVRRRVKAFDKSVTAASAPMPEPEVPEIVDPTTADPAEVAAETIEFIPAEHQGVPAPEPTTSPPPTQPAEGVAPAVDWNNPFG